MAETTIQQVILDAARGAAGNGDLGAQLTEATRRIDTLASVDQVLADVVAGNTDAVIGNTAAQGAKGIAAEAGKAASGILGSAFGLIPLVSGLAKLFGGGQPETPAPLVKYTPPVPVQVDARLQSTNTSAVFADQAGVTADSPVAPVRTTAPQITVQVQAMDSRSFLDHSHEIARAVREAMLEMNSINDVVSEL